MSPTSSLQLDLSGQPLSHRPLPGVPGQARKYWPLPPPPDHQPRPASGNYYTLHLDRGILTRERERDRATLFINRFLLFFWLVLLVYLH